MDRCLMCLKIIKKNMHSIMRDSAEWRGLGIAKKIEQHFWSLNIKQTHSRICSPCWQEVEAFHSFYLRIERAHKNYEKMLVTESEREEELITQITNVKHGVEQVDKNNVEYWLFEPEIFVDQSNSGDETDLADALEDASLETNVESLPSSDSQERDDPLEKTDNENSRKFRKRRHYNENQLQQENTTEGQKINATKEVIEYELDCSHLDYNHFQCVRCNQVLSDRIGLKNHICVKSSQKINKKHACYECGKTFVDLHELDIHKLTHQTEERKRYHCKECGKFYRNPYLLNRHKQDVHVRKIVKLCYICGKSLSSNTELEHHINEHEGKPRPIINCDICGLRVKTEKGLRKHKEGQHPVGGKKDHHCPICPRISPTQKALLKHINTMHKKGNEHKCTICEKVFKRAEVLREHMATHTGIPLYTCSWCPRTFNSNSNLHTHRKKMHLKEVEEIRLQKYSGNLNPTISDKNILIYDSSHLLNRHRQDVHMKKIVKMCYICGKSLSSNTELDIHISQHEGMPRPIINCDICGLHVTTKRGLKKHKEGQHPVGGKKEHHCPVCPKISPTRKALLKHINTMHKKGNEHKCTICEKVFKRAEVLREHMATHTGIPLYTCSWCPKTFNSNSNMYTHQRKLHSKEWQEFKLQKFTGNLRPTTSDKNNCSK